MRNLRLRERRLKLGVSQELIGCLAGWSPRGAQGTISAAERGVTKNPAVIRKVREAIIYLELEPRRRRREDQIEARAADAIEAAILLHRADAIVDRLVDLLFDGRTEDFDALADRVDQSIVDRAGELYLEGITPCVA
jgi:transcriptional regulator with XRE-family HTH domain